MYILAYIQRVYCTVRVRFLFQRFIVYSVYNSVLHTYSVIHFSNNYAPAPVGKGAINVAFVRSSVAYTANSRTQRLSVPKFGRFSTLDTTGIPVSTSNGQRSRSPGPLMLTRIVHYIVRMARPTNFKFDIWIEDDDPHQQQAP